MASTDFASASLFPMADLDFARNSRVILALGAAGFARLRTFRVGVIGLSPTGCEIVKNLALTGVGEIEVFDAGATTALDVGSNFFARARDVGRPRAACLVPRLARINARARVAAVDAASDAWVLSLGALVVAALRPLSELLRLSALAHAHGVQFVLAATLGATSLLFEDFGAFECADASGLPPKTIHFTAVTAHARAHVAVAPCDADVAVAPRELLRFARAPGLPALEGRTAAVACVVRARGGVASMRLHLDTTGAPRYDARAGVGALVEVKRAWRFAHAPLADPAAGGAPAPGRSLELRVRDLVLAAARFWDARGRPPRLLSAEDADAVAAAVPDLPQAARIAMLCGVEYPPNVGIVGGAAAQEAIKFCTGTFLPTADQLFVVDHSHVSTWAEPPRLAGNRGDALVAVVGEAAAQRIRAASALIVGVGAIGCEYARHAALLGISRIVLVDDDRIEPSNLTRQFLFRDKHRGMAKAAVGRAAVLKANSELRPENVVAFAERFEPRTLPLFPKGYSFVCSAVDSVPARHFIARFAKDRDIPMINAGMLKTQADFAYIVPGLTAPFAMADVAQSDAGSCTLRVQPTKPMHLIQWAQNEFVRFFQTQPESAIAAVSGTATVPVRSAGIRLLLRAPATFADCVQWAFSKFTRVMEFLPTALLAKHAPDSAFWQGTVLRVVPFDVAVPAHAEFIVAAAALKAQVHGVPVDGDARVIVAQCKKPPYRIEHFTDLESVAVVDHVALLEQFEAQKDALVAIASKIKPIIFDKDNEVHMDFVEGLIRARGEQRQIPLDNHDRLDLMKKIGSIAPTLATTTAMVGGGAFASLPLLLADATKGTRQRLNGAISLDGLSYDLMFPPPPTGKKRWGISDRFFGPWDVVECRGNPLTNEIVAKTKKEDGVVLSTWTLNAFFLDVEAGEGKRIVDFIREITHIIDDVYELEQSAEDGAGNSVELPPLRVWATSE
jgi:ubiquitin-activating enzyme E1